MNLSEFVEETLTEILTGIRAAQKKEGGQEIAAEMFSADGKAMGIIAGGTSGFFTIVQFDVSVLAETKAGGKAGLKVWSVGAEGGGEHTSQHTSRIKFSVHLKLPMSSKAPSSTFNRTL
jgi:hypothetical protein